MLSLAPLQPFEFRRSYKPCVGSKGAGCAPGGKRVASACGRDVGQASARAGPRARACRTQVCCGCRPKNSKEAATSATVGPLKRWRPGCRPKVGPLTRAGAKKARFWRRPCSCCRGLASSLRIRSQTGSRFCDLPPTWLWRPWRRRCRWRRRRHACASSAGGTSRTSPTMHQADVLLWPGLERAAFVRACFHNLLLGPHPRDLLPPTRGGPRPHCGCLVAVVRGRGAATFNSMRSSVSNLPRALWRRGSAKVEEKWRRCAFPGLLAWFFEPCLPRASCSKRAQNRKTNLLRIYL